MHSPDPKNKLFFQRIFMCLEIREPLHNKTNESINLDRDVIAR